MRRKPYLKIIIIMAILGILLSGSLLRIHFKNKVTPDVESFCDINQQLSCDDVDKTKYSEIMGVPVSFIGMLGYLGIMIISFAALRKKKLIGAIFYLASIGVAFSIYLTYLEAFVIGVFCPLCLMSFIFILSILILSYLAAK